MIWKALKRGEIDLYAEYTGTIMKEIFPNEGLKTVDDIHQQLLKENVLISQQLGFNSTYAISMKKEVAAKYGMIKISDLRHPDLRFGFTERFLARQDGWQSLRQTYQQPQTKCARTSPLSCL